MFLISRNVKNDFLNLIENENNFWINYMKYTRKFKCLNLYVQSLKDL